MNIEKFKLKRSSILESVEESYIKFIGDHWDDPMLEDLFKEMLNNTTKHTVHLQLIQELPNLIIFETSKYIMNQGFSDHQLWVFHKMYPYKKYCIYLTRYNIL